MSADVVLELLAKAPRLWGGFCPFCGVGVRLRYQASTWTVRGECDHLALSGGNGNVDPHVALASERSWQGDEEHPWPWSGGAPVSGLFFWDSPDGQRWVARHQS